MASLVVGVVLAGLRFAAPAGCPDQPAFVKLVEGHLDAPLGEVDVDITVEGNEDHWRARIATPGGGERTLDGKTCPEVVDAAALVVALLLKPEAPEPAPPKEPPRAVPAAVPTKSEATPVTLSHAPEPSGPRTGVALYLGPAADLGTLPGIAAGIAAGASISRSALTLVLQGSFWPERATTLEGAPGVGGAIDLWTVGLRGSWDLDWLAPVVGVEGGAMGGSAFGVADPKVNSVPWAAVSVGVLRSFKVATSLAFVAGIDAVVPLTRPRFTVLGGGELHQPSVVSGRLIIGLEVQIR